MRTIVLGVLLLMVPSCGKDSPVGVPSSLVQFQFEGVVSSLNQRGGDSPAGTLELGDPVVVDVSYLPNPKSQSCYETVCSFHDLRWGRMQVVIGSYAWRLPVDAIVVGESDTGDVVRFLGHTAEKLEFPGMVGRGELSVALVDSNVSSSLIVGHDLPLGAEDIRFRSPAQGTALIVSGDWSIWVRLTPALPAW